MNIWYRIFLALFVSFLAGIFLWAVFAPKEDLSARIYKTLKEQENTADLSFKDVSFEEVVDGTIYWQLLADKALVNNSTGLATLMTANGNFFQHGSPVLRFRSPAALWDMKHKEILLDQPLGYDTKLESKISGLLKKSEESNFSVFTLPENYTNTPGYWFKARNLSWKLEDQKILCTGGIILNKGEISGRAQSLAGDVALENVTLAGEPVIVINPPHSSPITIEADSFLVNSKNNSLTANGNPKINWQQAKILANSLRYDQKNKVLNLSGNAKINYNDIRAWGDSACYFTGEERIVISGRAHAIQGENSLTGDNIQVSLKSQKISVLGKGKVIISEETMPAKGVE